MTFLFILVGLVGLVGGATLSRRLRSPACPRCRARAWDRRLCAPLLFCRRCATRVDAAGTVYN